MSSLLGRLLRTVVYCCLICVLLPAYSQGSLPKFGVTPSPIATEPQAQSGGSISSVITAAHESSATDHTTLNGGPLAISKQHEGEGAVALSSHRLDSEVAASGNDFESMPGTINASEDNGGAVEQTNTVFHSSDQPAAIGGGRFALTDQEGIIITERSMLDQYTLVTFGFSRCPSICPEQLRMLSDVIDKVNELVSVFFITIDPEHDTVEVLKDFHKNFHKSIKMLTGTKEEIDKVVSDYKVYSSVDKENPEATSHSSIIYLMGKDGKYLAHFATNDPENLARELRMYIS